MNAPKHTPGPWTVDSANGYTVRCAQKAYPGAKKGGLICTVSHGSGERRGLAGMDAHLISSAPDLLEACRALLGEVTGFEPIDPEPEFVAALELAEKAIAKAEGTV
jgi:hypothetical protein